jgi:hypothetical protein
MTPELALRAFDLLVQPERTSDRSSGGLDTSFGHRGREPDTEKRARMIGPRWLNASSLKKRVQLGNADQRDMGRSPLPAANDEQGLPFYVCRAACLG